MSLNNGMYSSNTDKWATPQYLFDDLSNRYNFDVDVCATHDNAKCSKYFTEEQD